MADPDFCRGRPLHFPQTARCTNKANFRRGPGGSGAKGRGTRGEICKTNPIRGYAGWDEARGTRGRWRQTNPISRSGPAGAKGFTVQTKPICRRPGTSPFHCSIIPVFQSDRDGAKQTQFAATPRDEAWGRGANVRNKPNFGGLVGWAQGPLYKQTQFAAQRPRRPPQTGGLGHATPPRAIAPNKPNFRRRPVGPGVESIVQTKPISRDRAEAMDIESATIGRPHPTRCEQGTNC
jgi:hypothetical protein